jgi:hypothetical protein
MLDVLSTFRAGELIALVAVSGGLVIGLTAVIAGVWHKVRLAELQASLKQQMLNRGMSAVEIQQVLIASSPADASASEQKVVFSGNPVTDKAILAKFLAENGYEGNDIARVLEAFDPPPPGSKPESPQAKVEGVGNMFQKVMQAFQADFGKGCERAAGKG